MTPFLKIPVYSETSEEQTPTCLKDEVFAIGR